MAVSAATALVRLSLGPIQYHWSREAMLDFYDAIESTAVDVVYLGETVCSKRRSLRHRDWIGVAERLQAAGKEVVLSTLALVEAHSELGLVRKLCGNGTFMVEANDMAAVQMLSGKTPFTGGSSLNIYNQRTLRKLAGLGLTRWVMPVELSKSVLGALQKELPAAVETEVFAWGRLPLAYSARCYTARARKLTKDDCGNCCIDYPDGLMLSTREDERFLMLNGIQTQSARVHSLVHEAAAPAAGVDILRISPQARHTGQVLSLFDQVRRGTLPADDAARELESLAPDGLCDGYWHDQAGMAACGGACAQ
ncbi:MAG: U32 family peptidase [Gammaproteobacteria bacterium]|nr:MAG: U32 family peptidase [Gammaproteobacteria bacterium]